MHADDFQLITPTGGIAAVRLSPPGPVGVVDSGVSVAADDHERMVAAGQPTGDPVAMSPSGADAPIDNRLCTKSISVGPSLAGNSIHG